MAKRVSLEKFVTGMKAHFQKENGYTRTEIRSYGQYVGYTVPTEVWDYKSERNSWDFSELDFKNRCHISLEDIHQDETVDDIFSDLSMLVNVMTFGDVNSLIITGNAGIGKTYTVIQEMEKQGLIRDQDYVVLKSKSSPLGLYMNLFLHHDKIVVFDDLDSILTDTDSLNILKAALDSYDVREISWTNKSMVNVIGMDKSTIESICEETRQELLAGNTEVKLPNRFEFKGKVIFISNLSSENFDRAVLSRSINIDMTLSDKQIFSRMKSIVSKMESPEISEKAIQIVVNAYNQGEINLPNMRTIVNLVKMLKSGIDGAERLAKYC